jgi:acetyltransferase-like isoleucine patch superfamily enzyme
MMVLERVARKLAVLFASALGKAKLRLRGVRFGKGLTLYGLPIVSMAKGSFIQLGRNVVLCSWSSETALGVNHPTILRTMTPGAQIIIGDDVGLSGAAICAVQKVSIGAETLLGANVTIVDTDFHQVAPAGRRYQKDFSKIGAAEVSVGRNVFIGANTLVLKGVRIGDNSVIGAGSVVVKDIPENAIAVGNLCKVVKKVTLS